MPKYTGQASDLLKILEISSKLALGQDLQVLLKQIEQAAVIVLGCERATVFVYDPSANELFSLVADRQEKLRFPADSGIAGWCFKSGDLINVADAYQDARFNRTIDIQTGFKTHTILAAPLFGDSKERLGVLEVLNKKNGEFNERDKFLLEVLSAQCGIAIHRHALMREFAESKRLQQELSIARGIQRSLLPAAMPSIDGYDIAGWSQSAEETGGDFFDFHSLDDGQVILSLADVSGHGIGPALLAAECWALQQAAFSWEEDYRSSLTRINRLICRHIPDDRFITAFFGILHAKLDLFRFLSAGHGPVFILRVAENRVETLPVNALPLGIRADNCYEHWQAVTFNPCDILIAFTDGFFEWENYSGEHYGAQRICETVLHHAGLSANRIIECVYRDLLNFSEGSPQEDDLTAVVIKKLPHR